MTLAIFVAGIIVFLITVYGTVVAGGLLLTQRQMDDHPEQPPESLRLSARARALVKARF